MSAKIMITSRLLVMVMLSATCLAQDDFGTGDYSETGEGEVNPDYENPEPISTTMASTRTTSRATSVTTRRVTTTRRPTLATTSSSPPTTTPTRLTTPSSTMTTEFFRPQPSTRPQVATTPADYDYDEGPDFETDSPTKTTTTTLRPRTQRPTNRPGGRFPRPTNRPTIRPGGTRVPRPTERPANEDGLSTTRRPNYNNVVWEEDTLWNRLGNYFNQLFNVNNVNTGNVFDQIGNFINVFRYQGYDNHHHFHHCTQLVGGCKFPQLGTTSEPSFDYDNNGDDNNGDDNSGDDDNDGDDDQDSSTGESLERARRPRPMSGRPRTTSTAITPAPRRQRGPHLGQQLQSFKNFNSTKLFISSRF